ncbi:carbohydrate ABC transporter permease [Romboutsia sp.]|uniref:carbohydrate ABC transporter permease n=1 Tax=Romboutsia sp. TaxID=1965302 RepID=UPI003F388BEA
MKNISYKGRKTIGSIINYLFLSIVSLISIFPFYWMVISATNNRKDIIVGKLTPGSEFMNNLNGLLDMSNIGQAFINTTKLTLITMVISIIVASMAGYGFAKFSSKGKDKVYSLLLFSMMIPFAAMMIPLFQLVAKMGLVDNHWAIILPGSISIFLIFFFRQNFSTFPTEIIEAVRIDGASEFTIFFRLVVPSMKSTFAAAAIWSFMTNWNNFMWPLISLQSDGQKTLTLVLSSLSSAYFVEYGSLMVAIVIAITPVIIVFLTMQKHFVAGVIGSSK